MVRWGVLAGVCLLVACGAPPDLAVVGSAEQNMINGSAPTKPLDDAVGALLRTVRVENGGVTVTMVSPFCSGTLIAPAWF